MMAAEPAWPPPSARAALLSSPSGRRKLEERRIANGYGTSPIRSSHQTSSFQDRLHAAKESQATSDEEEDNDDEETLQLKLAAIEAKLKLKKLQQSKSRTTRRDNETDRPLSRNVTAAAVEVPLSPSKRLIPQVEPRSPGRVLLGIDKGIRGIDVSLRRARARTVHRSPLKDDGTISADGDRPSCRSAIFGSARSVVSTASSTTSYTKSFSEKMAEIRDKERIQKDKRNSLHRKRTMGLKLNEAELDSYRLAAEEARKHDPPRSCTPRHPAADLKRDDILAIHSPASNRLKKSQSTPNLQQSSSHDRSPGKEQSHDKSEIRPRGDPSLYEPFSHIHLSSRILPHSFLKRTLPTDEFTSLRIPDLLRQVSAPTYELPDTIVNYAIFGIIASKSSPLDHKRNSEDKSKGTSDWEKKWEDGSQNQNRFMAFQVTDLKWSISFYLFGTAVPRYHRLTPGTVIAILNPNIMPPKEGKEDTGAFSLSLNNSEDTVLEIGTARDLGFCNAVKKDGKECGEWVDTSKTEICEWHLANSIKKTQSSRMGVNTGGNGFSGGRKYDNKFAGGRGKEDGLKPRMEGHQYDKFTGSHYFISSSNAGASTGRTSGAPIFNSERSTAQMLDLDDDDPFIAEGQLARDDKAGRLRKRLATQEKEREIGRVLGGIGGGGAGGEYLRHRTGAGGNEAGSQGQNSSQRTAAAAKVDIMTSGIRRDVSRKRMAENVRLSPVKKTRFVTDRGIKEAGRESLGTLQDAGADDDDELDIV